jgi:hypothetical protein
MGGGDPELWEITQTPWMVLQTVSLEQIERVLADPVFRKSVDSRVHRVVKSRSPRQRLLWAGTQSFAHRSSCSPLNA